MREKRFYREINILLILLLLGVKVNFEGFTKGGITSIKSPQTIL